jgi:hypothetical protein
MIREAVETVILTGRLKGHSPVSLLLIASPESGKTSVVLEKDCVGVVAVTDVTGRGLQELCKNKSEISHIVINDLVAVSAHKSSVSKYTMSMINAMTEEGIVATAFPGQFEAYKDGKRGIIASIPTTMAKDGRGWWNKIGLSSRMLPLAFKHSDDLNVRIKGIISGSKKPAKTIAVTPVFQIPAVPIYVPISQGHANQIQRIAETVSMKFKEEGYRRLKQFRALACAHALLRSWRNPVVTERDIEFLKKLQPFISYTTPREIG